MAAHVHSPAAARAPSPPLGLTLPLPCPLPLQSKEKVLAKMVREGLTEKVEADRVVKFKFENVGSLPPPVLQVRPPSASLC